MWVVPTPKTRRALRPEEETLRFPSSSREPFLTQAYHIVVVEYGIRPERLCSIPHQHNRIISKFLHFGSSSICPHLKHVELPVGPRPG
jgi:hypothetical protein